MLKAWLFRQSNIHCKLLDGPIDKVTGKILPEPKWENPALVPYNPITHSQRGPKTPTTYLPVNAYYGSGINHTASTYYASQKRIMQPLPGAGHVPPSFPNYASSARMNPPSGSGYPGCVSQKQSGQASLAMPISPVLSSSSRNSSISTLSTIMLPDTSTYDTMPTFRSTPSKLDTPFTSRAGSFSGTSVASNTPRGYAQAPTPPPSVSENASQPSTPTSQPAEHYNVTIRNLSPQATRDLVYKLLENNTRIYVELMQPDGLKLSKVTGSLRAQVKFTREEDAEKALENLHGHTFMNKKLHVSMD